MLMNQKAADLKGKNNPIGIFKTHNDTCVRFILLPLNNGINGQYSVEDGDLHKKQSQKCNGHCVCPHYNIWRAHQTDQNKDSLLSFFF